MTDFIFLDVKTTARRQLVDSVAGSTFNPAHQHSPALNLGADEPAARLGITVGATLHGVHVQEGEHIRHRQQRCARGRRGQQQTVDLLQLADVSPGERAKERAEGGRGADAVNNLPMRRAATRPDLRWSRPRGASRPRSRRFHRHVHAEPVGDGHVLIVEDRTSLHQSVRNLHLGDALSNELIEASRTSIIPGPRASPFALRAFRSETARCSARCQCTPQSADSSIDQSIGVPFHGLRMEHFKGGDCRIEGIWVGGGDTAISKSVWPEACAGHGRVTVGVAVG